MSTHHIQMSVGTVLRMLRSKRETRMLERMFEVPAEDIHLECEQLIQDGKLYLPTAGCTTKDPTGKCHGHRSKAAQPTNQPPKEVIDG